MESFDLNTLVAYVDGELDPETAAEVEAFLQRSGDAREVVRAFRETAALARAALNGPLNEAVPDRLIETVMRHGKANVVSLPGRALGRVARWGLAASLLVSVGAAGGWLGGRLDNTPERLAALARADAEVAARTLQQTLETKVSGTEVRWQNPDSGSAGFVHPVRTFRGQDGRYCREYRQESITMGKDDRRIGIACRDKNGTWKIRFEIVPGDDGHASL